MPITKYVIKNTPRQAVVAIHGNDGQTIIAPADLAYAGQTVDLPNVTLTISSIHYQIEKFANIRRSSNSVINFVAGYDTVRFAEDLGFTLGGNVGMLANANITINVGGGNNSIFLQLTKSEGYNETNRQVLQPKDR